MADAPVKLSPADWEQLLGGKAHTLGSTELVLRPLSLSDFADVLTLLEPLRADFTEEEITTDNIREKIVPLAALLIRKAPAVLAKATSLRQEDVQRLPIKAVVPLLSDALEVNLGSIEQLRKNWDSLVQRVQPLWQGADQGASSQKSPTSSSRKATRGRK